MLILDLKQITRFERSFFFFLQNCFQNQPVEATQLVALKHQEKRVLGVGWQYVRKGRRAL